MSDFDYYKYGTRLIRVNEENKHYRDITPDKTTHLMSDYLQEKFPEGFEFISTLNFTLDNDEFMKLYNSFKTNINKVVLSNGNRVGEDQRVLINRHLEAGSSIRTIAKLTGISKSTIHRLSNDLKLGCAML